MNENAYESPTVVDTPPKTRGTRWAIWSGIVCLLLAVLCVIATVAGMIVSFNNVASDANTPSAEELAAGISRSMIPFYGAIPLGLAGVVLLVIGFLVRRPA